MVRNVWNVSLHVVGVKARCRKIEHHMVNIGDLDEKPGAFCRADLEKQLAGFRRVDRAIIVVHPHRLRDAWNGIYFREVTMFDKERFQYDI